MFLSISENKLLLVTSVCFATLTCILGYFMILHIWHARFSLWNDDMDRVSFVQKTSLIYLSDLSIVNKIRFIVKACRNVDVMLISEQMISFTQKRHVDWVSWICLLNLGILKWSWIFMLLIHVMLGQVFIEYFNMKSDFQY